MNSARSAKKKGSNINGTTGSRSTENPFAGAMPWSQATCDAVWAGCTYSATRLSRREPGWCDTRNCYGSRRTTRGKERLDRALGHLRGAYVSGAWEETGKETLARARTGLKPEAPVRKIEG